MVVCGGRGRSYGYEDCRGHPGAPPIRYYAHSTLSGSTEGRKTLSCIERGLLLRQAGVRVALRLLTSSSTHAPASPHKPFQERRVLASGPRLSQPAVYATPGGAMPLAMRRYCLAIAPINRTTQGQAIYIARFLLVVGGEPVRA